ncbi:MAG: DUF4317 family protein [Eubacterium sp.]|nr:DUF4317 family protein [Eubacterium sp.]
MIDRHDMLELTRRMNPERSCFSRIAGAYMDADGYIDNTFNVHFLNLNNSDKKKNLAIAKTIPFSRTNDQLVEYRFSKQAEAPGSMYQLLAGIQDCGLKNDLLLEVLYEQIGKTYRADADYAIHVFHGVYDVPKKGSDGLEEWESEDVYDFLICAVSPLLEDYEVGKPDFGFLFPAFANRCAFLDAVDIFTGDAARPQQDLIRLLLGKS